MKINRRFVTVDAAQVRRRALFPSNCVYPLLEMNVKESAPAVGVFLINFYLLTFIGFFPFFLFFVFFVLFTTVTKKKKEKKRVVTRYKGIPVLSNFISSGNQSSVESSTIDISYEDFRDTKRIYGDYHDLDFIPLYFYTLRYSCNNLYRFHRNVFRVFSFFNPKQLRVMYTSWNNFYSTGSVNDFNILAVLHIYV